MKGLEKGRGNKDVAAKHGLPENTVSTLKRKKREEQKICDHELVEKAVSNSVLSMQSQNVPLSVSVIQEKAVTFANNWTLKTSRH